MRNRFEGTCYRCKQKVEPYAGHFEKIKGASRGLPKWRLQHAECAIAWRNNDKAKIAMILTGSKPQQ